jgi:hypothetical protein
MDVGFLLDWLVFYSKGDVINSQIMSIDVLALSHKGETCIQLLLFTVFVVLLVQ